MNRAKQFFSTIFLAMLCLAIATGCSGRNSNSGRPTIVATSFAAWDWARETLGARTSAVELVLLSGNGADLHSFQPTASDIKTIAKCDLFIFVGGESDEWAHKVLKATENPNRRTISLVEVIGKNAKAEELVDGMQGDDDEDGAVDEHVWLSLRNAKKIVGALSDEISVLDRAGEAEIRKNAAAYCEELDKLDAEYTLALSSVPSRTIVVADRFPLRYLADDYSIRYFAAFPGCSAETRASFKTIAFLARKADECGVSSLLVLEGPDKKIANAVLENMNRKGTSIAVFDSLQSARPKDGTYLGKMRQNLETLKKALPRE